MNGVHGHIQNVVLLVEGENRQLQEKKVFVSQISLDIVLELIPEPLPATQEDVLTTHREYPNVVNIS